MNIEKKIITFLKSKKRDYTGFKDIIKIFPRSVPTKNVSASLNDMKQKGILIEKRSKFALSENFGYKSARITRISGNFGFAKIISTDPNQEDPDVPEVFIPGKFLAGSLVGDTVIINIFRKADENNRSDTAEVICLSCQNSKNFSGVVKRDAENGNLYLVSDSIGNFPLFIAKSDLNGAKEGDKVLANISFRGKSHSAHNAVVINVFGNQNYAKNSCDAFLAANEIETEFSDEVINYADSIAEKSITERDLVYRIDLRQENIFTIDSADTKDIDDAISIEKEGENWLLGVHIADVSHYVKSKSVLDSEAFERATSIYYANSVIPMLPKSLSNGVCSLNPNEDRLAFSCFIKIDSKGNIINYKFKKSIINSKVKGVYSEINSIIENRETPEIKEKYSSLLNEIKLMHSLAGILNKNRFARGGLNLDSSESKIIIDNNGFVVDIKQRERGISENIIEEFMLMANQCAANLARELDLPFVYRVHEDPPEAKISTLKEVLKTLGYTNIKDNLTQSDLAKILDKSKGTSKERVINNQVLRSMAKAKYSEIPIGHFGLVLKDYAHFTSPIRRYPDLCIHRILADIVQLQEKKTTHDAITKKYSAFVKKAASQSTSRELLAMQCERSCEDFYKAEYISKHIGEEFNGVISGVTSFGIYVELENTVEGLCRIENMPEGNYVFDGTINLTETLSGKNYLFGNEVKIKVISADVGAGKIDFAIVE